MRTAVYAEPLERHTVPEGVRHLKDSVFNDLWEKRSVFVSYSINTDISKTELLDFSQKSQYTQKHAFTKDDTKAMKGIAVVLMMLHHLWGFPNRLPMDKQLCGFEIMVYGKDLMYVVGTFGKICVAIFSFLGGYGLWKKTRSSYSLTSDIIRLYKALWKVAIIYVPIGILFFSNQPDYAENSVFCHVFDDASLKNIVSNALGLSASYNREWWFFQTYLGALVMGYIFISVDKIDNFWVDAFIVVLIEIATQKILPAMFAAENYQALRNDMFYYLLIAFKGCVCAFFMGIVFAKYDAMVSLRERYVQTVKTQVGRLVVSFIGICSIFICRQICIDADYDMFYVPFWILFCCEWLDRLKSLGKLFGVLGKHSTNMWLIHSFYCYYFFPVARFVCWSKNPFVSLFVLTVMSFISSVVLDWMAGVIGQRTL